MTKLTTAILMGWLTLEAAWAQSAAQPFMNDSMVLAHNPWRLLQEDVNTINVSPQDGTLKPGRIGFSLGMREGTGQELLPSIVGLRRRFLDFAATYRFPGAGQGAVFGYMGFAAGSDPGRAAALYVNGAEGIGSRSMFVNPTEVMADTDSSVFALGYSWRDMRVEGASVSEQSQLDKESISQKKFKLARFTRLSFSSSPQWAFQLGRGSVSGVDHVLPDRGVRRTTMSATYHRALEKAAWQIAFAWGKNSRRGHESTMGYLLESTLRFGAGHLAFGRLEQVGSDELFRVNESLPRQLFKLNKFTIGYFHRLGGKDDSGKPGIGIVASKYLVPASMAHLYGDDPISFLMFMRLPLH